MPTTCIICYTQIHATDNLSKSTRESSTGHYCHLPSPDRSEILTRFFELVGRYLDDASEKGQHGVVTKRSLIAEMVDSGMIACGICSKIAESYCDLYHQMKTIELKLNWKLWRLNNIISDAHKMPERMQKFREIYTQEQRELNWQDMENDNDKDNISEQRIDLLLDYNKELVKKCRQKLGAAFPKLEIRRMCLSETENIAEMSAEFTPNTEMTTSRLRTVYRCPKCRKTFSSAGKLDQRKPFHENYKQTVTEDATSGVEEEGTDYEKSDLTFEPVTESFPDDERDELLYGLKTGAVADGGVKCFQLEDVPLKVPASIKVSDYNPHETDNSDSDEDPKLGCAIIKSERSDEDSDSDIDYLEDWDEDTESRDDPSSISSTPTKLKRTTMETERTKLSNSTGKDSHPPIKLVPGLPTNDWKLQYIRGPSIGEYKCKLDSQIYVGIEAFRSHFQKSHGQLKYKCPFCIKSYTHRQNCKRHRDEVHMGIRPSRVNCKICNMSLASKRNLIIHCQNVHKRLKINCPVCKKDFAARQGLVAHQRRTDCGKKTGANRTYACEQCGKGCRGNFELKLHMRVHLSKEAHLSLRKHVCELCGAKFGWKDSLTRHRRQKHKISKQMKHHDNEKLPLRKKSLVEMEEEGNESGRDGTLGDNETEMDEDSKKDSDGDEDDGNANMENCELEGKDKDKPSSSSISTGYGQEDDGDGGSDIEASTSGENGKSLLPVASTNLETGIFNRGLGPQDIKSIQVCQPPAKSSQNKAGFKWVSLERNICPTNYSEKANLRGYGNDPDQQMPGKECARSVRKSLVLEFPLD